MRDQVLGETEPLLEFDKVATTIVTVAQGYSEAYRKGDAIAGLEGEEEDEGWSSFIWVQPKRMGLWSPLEGVLAVSALGDFIDEARQSL